MYNITSIITWMNVCLGVVLQGGPSGDDSVMVTTPVKKSLKNRNHH